MKIIISTDSTSDLPQEVLTKYNIAVMPLLVNLGEEEFEDGTDFNIQQVFDFVKKKGVLPKTAARSIYNYKEFFENFMEKNQADALIHISLSSEFSSSYSNAKLASEELKNVYIVDSRSLSSGAGLLALSACDKINEGKDVETILSELKEEITKVQASFIISDLRYLYKGGRCSAVAVFGANLMRIKPKIKLFNGKMVVDKKYMGKYENVIIKYVQDMLEQYPENNLSRAFITYTSQDNELIDQIIDLLKKAGFKEVIINSAGATISSHCGENCLGILFISKKDIE